MNKWFYIKMIWRNSPLINVISILFMLPFFIMIFTLIIQNVISPINHLQFLNRSNFEYESNMDIYSDETKGDDFYLKRANTLLLVKTNEEGEGLRLGTTIYFTKYSSNTEKSYFTKDNIIVRDKSLSKSSEKYDGSLYLSYDTASAIGKKQGDYIKIGFFVDAEYGKKLVSKNFVIAGLVKPYYKDEEPVKSLEGNISLALVSKEDYDWIKYLDSTLVAFSDDEIEGDSVLMSLSKTQKTEETVRYIKSLTNIYKVLFSLVFSFLALIAILAFETNYLRKKHKSNMTTMNLMGMPLKDIRSTFRIIITGNILVAAILSLVITNIIILKRVLYIYVEVLPLLAVFILVLLTSIIMAYLQSIKIKKV